MASLSYLLLLALGLLENLVNCVPQGKMSSPYIAAFARAKGMTQWLSRPYRCQSNSSRPDQRQIWQLQLVLAVPLVAGATLSLMHVRRNPLSRRY